MNINEPAITARKSWPRRHKILTGLGAAGALVITFGVIGAVAGSPSPSSTPKTPAPATSTAPATPTAAAAAAPVLKVTRVRFIVTGTGDPSITYGSDADNRDGGGTIGMLGDGNALPWHASMRFRGDAQYYSLDAQLEGGGDIHCKIVVSGPNINTMTVSSGHASGGENICSVQAAPNDASGSSWQNEG